MTSYLAITVIEEGGMISVRGRVYAIAYDDPVVEEVRHILARREKELREKEKREPGDENNYLCGEDGSYTCRKCKHPAYLAPIVKDIDWQGCLIYDYVLFCPICDKMPVSYGAPFMP